MVLYNFNNDEIVSSIILLLRVSPSVYFFLLPIGYRFFVSAMIGCFEYLRL